MTATEARTLTELNRPSEYDYLMTYIKKATQEGQYRLHCGGKTFAGETLGKLRHNGYEVGLVNAAEGKVSYISWENAK